MIVQNNENLPHSKTGIIWNIYIFHIIREIMTIMITNADAQI